MQVFRCPRAPGVLLLALFFLALADFIFFRYAGASIDS